MVNDLVNDFVTLHHHHTVECCVQVLERNQLIVIFNCVRLMADGLVGCHGAHARIHAMVEFELVNEHVTIQTRNVVVSSVPVLRRIEIDAAWSTVPLMVRGHNGQYGHIVAQLVVAE